jgi:hypothetical protein
MDNVEVITIVTYLFFIYLVLALLIERILEVLLAVYNYFEIKRNWFRLWDQLAEKYQSRFERLYGYQGEGDEKKKKVLDWVLWKAITEPSYTGGKPVISANLIRLNYIRIATRVLALIMALVLVISQKLDLVATVERIVPETEMAAFITHSNFVRVLFTAIAISIGSEPLHQLISRIEKVAERKTVSSTGGQS